jgi:hypothetical protein
VIAKSLNVDAIIEGSVAREGGQVRITANLIDARVDSTIWTMTLTRNSNDVLASRPPWRQRSQSQIKVQLTAHEKARFASAPTSTRKRTTPISSAATSSIGRAMKSSKGDQAVRNRHADSTFAAGFSRIVGCLPGLVITKAS